MTLATKPLSPWTAARNARLTELWPTGLSASKIAADLGGGLSRSAVLAHATRILKLPRRRPDGPKPEKVKPVPRPQKRSHPHKLPVAATGVRPPFKTDGNVLTVLTARDGQCRWIEGDVREGAIEVCGQPVAHIGRAWCCEHEKRVYAAGQPPRIREPKFG